VGDACAAAVPRQLTPSPLPPGRACHVCHSHVYLPPSLPPKPYPGLTTARSELPGGFHPSPTATGFATERSHRSGPDYMATSALQTRRAQPSRPHTRPSSACRAVVSRSTAEPACTRRDALLALPSGTLLWQLVATASAGALHCATAAPAAVAAPAGASDAARAAALKAVEKTVTKTKARRWHARSACLHAPASRTCLHSRALVAPAQAAGGVPVAGRGGAAAGVPRRGHLQQAGGRWRHERLHTLRAGPP
jgi:hypothetical protein